MRVQEIPAMKEENEEKRQKWQKCRLFFILITILCVVLSVLSHYPTLDMMFMIRQEVMEDKIDSDRLVNLRKLKIESAFITPTPTTTRTTLSNAAIHPTDTSTTSSISPTLTEKQKVRIVVFIPSPIQTPERRYYVNRQFQREQWKSSEVKILWVFGSKTGTQLENSLNYTSVFHEPLMKEDEILITQCRDFGDEFNNPNGTSGTTCKTYFAIKYIYEHYDAEFIWRGADDAYLNLKLFFQLIPKLPKERIWIGQKRSTWNPFDLNLKNQPNLQQLYGIPQLSTNYMLGMGFAFSYDIVELLATFKFIPHLTWCEDVMVGMWLMMFPINRVNSWLFINRAGSSGNPIPLDETTGNLTVLLLHYMEPENWDHIYDDGIIFIPCPPGKHCTPAGIDHKRQFNMTIKEAWKDHVHHSSTNNFVHLGKHGHHPQHHHQHPHHQHPNAADAVAANSGKENPGN